MMNNNLKSLILFLYIRSTKEAFHLKYNFTTCLFVIIHSLCSHYESSLNILHKTSRFSRRDSVCYIPHTLFVIIHSLCSIMIQFFLSSVSRENWYFRCHMDIERTLHVRTNPISTYLDCNPLRSLNSHCTLSTKT